MLQTLHPARFCLSLLQDRSLSGKIMTSFDVTSLFTNVPVDFTINLILDPYPQERRV